MDLGFVKTFQRDISVVTGINFMKMEIGNLMRQYCFDKQMIDAQD